jgi:hypothetical protein
MVELPHATRATCVPIPYLGTAALVTCFVPVALWLSRIEVRAATAP